MAALCSVTWFCDPALVDPTFEETDILVAGRGPLCALVGVPLCGVDGI